MRKIIRDIRIAIARSINFARQWPWKLREFLTLMRHCWKYAHCYESNKHQPVAFWIRNHPDCPLTESTVIVTNCEVAKSHAKRKMSIETVGQEIATHIWPACRSMSARSSRLTEEIWAFLRENEAKKRPGGFYED